MKSFRVTPSFALWAVVPVLLTSFAAAVWAAGVFEPGKSSARDDHLLAPDNPYATLAANGTQMAPVVLAAAEATLPFHVRVPDTLPPGATPIHATIGVVATRGTGQIDFTFGMLGDDGKPDARRPLIHSYQDNQPAGEKPSPPADAAVDIAGQKWQFRRLEYPQPGGPPLVVLEIERTFDDGVSVFLDTRVIDSEPEAMAVLASAAASLK